MLWNDTDNVQMCIKKAILLKALTLMSLVQHKCNVPLSFWMQTYDATVSLK